MNLFGVKDRNFIEFVDLTIQVSQTEVSEEKIDNKNVIEL